MKHRSLVGLLILLLVTAATPTLASSPDWDAFLKPNQVGTSTYDYEGEVCDEVSFGVHLVLPGNTWQFIAGELLFTPEGGGVQQSIAFAVAPPSMHAYVALPGEGVFNGGWASVTPTPNEPVTFVISNICRPPLSVTVQDFAAACHLTNTQVTWVTTSEIDILGFNLYRGMNDTFADAVRITDEPIMAQSPGSTQGNFYGYLDWAIQPSTSYWYWLEVIHINPVVSLVGPAAAICTPTAVTMTGFDADNGKFRSDLPLLLVVAVVLVGGWYLVTHSRRRRSTS